MMSTASLARISYSTIVENMVERNHPTQIVGGAGLYVTGELHITGTIVAENALEEGGLGVGVDIRVNNGTATSHGHNLIGNLTDSNFSTTVTDGHSLPARLTPLADNGGPTRTMLPLNNSYAVNNGHAGQCQDTLGQQIRYDQMSVSRPQGDHCTIGAVELRN